jgi:hypothetical protein
VPDSADREQEAQRAIDGAARDSEALGTSSLARTGRQRSDHVGGRGPLNGGEAATDPVEIWGRRVGRALSVPAALLLIWWLGHQLGWWGQPL